MKETLEDDIIICNTTTIGLVMPCVCVCVCVYVCVCVIRTSLKLDFISHKRRGGYYTILLLINTYNQGHNNRLITICLTAAISLLLHLKFR